MELMWSSPWSMVIGALLPIFAAIIAVELIVGLSHSALDDAADDE